MRTWIPDYSTQLWFPQGSTALLSASVSIQDHPHPTSSAEHSLPSSLQPCLGGGQGLGGGEGSAPSGSHLPGKALESVFGHGGMFPGRHPFWHRDTARRPAASHSSSGTRVHTGPARQSAAAVTFRAQETGKDSVLSCLPPGLNESSEPLCEVVTVTASSLQVRKLRLWERDLLPPRSL